MKLLNCPINGPRPLGEFQYGGEYRTAPNADTCTDAQWADYVFNRSGEPGVKLESWYHVPSATWLIAERDTLQDEFRRVWLYEEFLNRE